MRWRKERKNTRKGQRLKNGMEIRKEESIKIEGQGEEEKALKKKNAV